MYRYGAHRQTSIYIWVLIGFTVLATLATTVNRPLLFELGLSPATWDRRPWTILTSMFVHAGLWHLAANMFTFYFFANYLDDLIGSTRLFIIYFVGGILGGILYVLLAPRFSIAVGASGAIFALGGALAMLRPKVRIIVFPIPSPIPLWAAVVGGFVVMSFLPAVAWQAHLGGLLFGLASGYAFKRRRPI